ncbi:hypothetical protein F5B19DRAFT_231907 [Rostrohypoxylon terebratum]|nr:hypothetical protein F5B19DRAFT_231907 [Rostrohypoxylon terebratum]
MASSPDKDELALSSASGSSTEGGGLAGNRKDYGKTVDDTHKRIQHMADNLTVRLANMETRFDHGQHDLRNTSTNISVQMASMDRHIHALDDKMDRIERMIAALSPNTPQSSPTEPSAGPSAGLNTGSNAGTQNTGINPLPYNNTFPYSTPPVNSTDAERLPNGKINLHRKPNEQYAIGSQEERIKGIWPDVVLSTEASYFQRCEEKNKVVIPSNLKLVWADNTVLEKLTEIQNRLKIALIPYKVWSTRVATELSGDFQQVAVFARTWNPDWVTFVESIIQVLEEHHVLHSPLVTFATMLPYHEESQLNFMRRVREAFYKLSIDSRGSFQTREIIVNVLRTYAPSVWLSIHDNMEGLNNAQVVEEAVRRAGIVSRQVVENKIYGTPETTVQLHGTTAPFYEMKISDATPSRPGTAQVTPLDATKTIPLAAQTATISDPRRDDHQVSTANERALTARADDNECFNCGKKGHWAKDCRVKPKFPRNTPSGENVTIKGTLYKTKNNNRQRFGRKVKQAYNNWKNKGDRRVQFVDNEDNENEDEIAQSPADSIEGYNIDQELVDIFETLVTDED